MHLAVNARGVGPRAARGERPPDAPTRPRGVPRGAQRYFGAGDRASLGAVAPSPRAQATYPSALRI